jgi:transcription elongation factor GreA
MAPLSPEVRKRLQDELAVLEEEHGILAARDPDDERIGDRGDAALYPQHVDAIDWLNHRIADINEMLMRNELPDTSLPDGTEVTLEFEDGHRETLRAIAVPEEVPDEELAKVFTADSPLGAALAGHEEGDTVTYRSPNGPVTVKIVELRLPNPT